jgi:hypothetical protein
MTGRLLTIALIGLACGFGCIDPRQPTGGSIPTAEKVRGDALAKAKWQDKCVFLLFTTAGEGANDEWSDRYRQFLARDKVKAVFDRHFVRADIDVVNTPGGSHLYQECGGTGTIPAFTILDGNGMMLAESGAGDENIGFPVSASEVDRFFTALRMARPTLSAAEEATLLDALKELQPASSSNPATNPDRPSDPTN